MRSGGTTVRCWEAVHRIPGKARQPELEEVPKRAREVVLVRSEGGAQTTARKADRMRRVGWVLCQREGEHRARRRMDEEEQRKRRRAGKEMRHGERERGMLDRMGVEVRRAIASPEVPAEGSKAVVRRRSEGSPRAILREDLQSSCDPV